MLGSNMVDTVWGYNSLYWVGAFGSTVVLAKTDADRDIQDWFIEEDRLGRTVPRAMYWTGIFIQPTIGASLYLGGLWFDRPYVATGGAALLQSIGIISIYNLFFKYLAGRKPPGCCNSPRDFQFQPFKQDLLLTKRQSWPSGHTSSTFVMVASLHGYFEANYIAYLGYPFATLMAVSMVDWDYHWASDVIAGALMGIVVGYVVGRNFRKAYAAANGDLSQKIEPGYFQVASVEPIFSGDKIGLQVSAAFQ